MLLFIYASVSAQIAQEDLYTYDAKETIYNKEVSFSLKFHTNGYGIALNKGKFVDYYKQKLWQLELLEIKHPKESRQPGVVGSQQQNAKSFKYGKINNFYNLNFSLGKRKLLTEKAEKSGVAVSLFYAGGISLGLLKPYYLELVVDDPETGDVKRQDIKYTEETAAIFLNKERTVGSSGIAFGLDEMKFRPGLQGKIGVNFDWAAMDEYIKALELGLMLNVYTERITILATDENSFLFGNLYLKFVIGKRS